MWTLVQHKKYFELVLKVSFFLKMIADGKERNPPEQKGRNRSFRFGGNICSEHILVQKLWTLYWKVKLWALETSETHHKWRDVQFLQIQCSLRFAWHCYTHSREFSCHIGYETFSPALETTTSRIININLFQRRPRDWLRTGLSSRFP